MLRGYSRVVVGVTCVLQVVAATAIMVVTALKLHHVDIQWDTSGFNLNLDNTCLLGTMGNGGNLCYLAYLAGGCSVLATGLLSLLQCCTCSLCGLGMLLNAVFATAGTLLWVVVGIIFQENYHREAAPRPEWRLSITVLSYGAAALFALMAAAALYSLVSTLMCCGGTGCGGSGGSSSSGKKHRSDSAHDMEGGGVGGGGSYYNKQQQQFIAG